MSFIKYLFKKQNNSVIKQNRYIRDKALLNLNLNELLHKLEEDKDLSVIPELFWYLLSNDIEKKTKIIKCLYKSINKLSFSQLTKLDKLFRERTSIEWSYNWRSEEPKTLVFENITDDEACCIFGIASFHPNGYFREKAIIELSKLTTGKELSYLLIRYNDWVEEIRIITEMAILRRISKPNIKYIIDNLPLLYRLKGLKRYNNSELLNNAITLISEQATKDELLYGLSSNESKVRYYCFMIILEHHLMNNLTVLKLIFKEPYPYIRLKIVNQIKAYLSKDEFDNVKEQLMNDKYFAIRVVYLELLYKFYSNNSIELLKEELLDGHASVRETARYLLSKGLNINYSEIYRDAINNNKSLYGAIQGLGETGNSNDVCCLIKFLSEKRVKIVRVTIKALIKLDIDIDDKILLPYLEDERAGVSKEVRRVISKYKKNVDPDKIHNIYENNNTFHVKKNAAILLSNFSKWISISYILETCSDKDGNISRIGKQALQKWKMNFNKSFISPSECEIKVLLNAIQKYEYGIENSNIEWIEFMIKPYLK